MTGRDGQGGRTSAGWWGSFDFAEGQTRCWRLGPFAMWITRRASEYRISTGSGPEPETAAAAGEPVTDPAPAEADTMRFGVRDSVRKLEIGAATADRAVIVKSEDAYVVPPDGAVTAFISTPIWLQIRLTSPLRPLLEVPTQRPSDTWFGPSTLAGELCYAIRTSVRYSLMNVPPRPNRAISVVRIINHAESPLPLARLRLPLPHLSLFASGDGRLWTEAVTLDRQEDGDLAEIKLGKSAPRDAGDCTRVCGPRTEMGRQPLIRSFTGLLGLTEGKRGYERVVE